MPNDAKLGLVIGTGLVILIAVVFFRRDPATAREGPEQPAAAAAVGPSGLLPALAPGGRGGAVKAKTAAGSQALPAHGMKHTVKEGETLFSLAQQYYKDGGKFVDLYRANQEVLREPDRLEPGTVLVIPELAE